MKRFLLAIGAALFGIVLFALVAQAQPPAFDCTQVTEIPHAECEALVAFFTSTDGPQWGGDQGGWLHSNTPCSWAGITCAAGHVTSIYMDDPWCREGLLNIAGELPASGLGALTELEIFDLDHCHVGGAIPDFTFAGLSQLRVLDLSSNVVTGPLPEQLGDLRSLTDFVFGDNPMLRGSLIPEIGRLANLNYIPIHDTALYGPLPQSMMNLQNVDRFWFQNTDLCIPTNANFRQWLAGIDMVQHDPDSDCDRIGDATLTVRALVDGVSQLVIQGDHAYWNHISWAAPGRHNFVNEPTYFNHAVWYPQWPDTPNTENRDCQCTSSTYTSVPALAAIEQDVVLDPLWVRHGVSIIQQPRSGNDFTLIVQFNDGPPSGDDWYTVNLTYQRAEPEEATITIILDQQPNSRANVRFESTLGAFRLDDSTPDDGDAYKASQTFTVDPGDYTFKENVTFSQVAVNTVCTPNDKVSIHANTATVTVGGGDAVSCTFVTQQRGTVRAFVYNDQTRFGKFTPDDTALAGWQLQLYDSNDAMVGSKRTNEQGKVSFTRLTPGEYTLCEVLPPGWSNTQPANLDPTYGQPCYNFTLAAATTVEGRFGNRFGVSSAGETTPDPGLLVSAAFIDTGAADADVTAVEAPVEAVDEWLTAPAVPNDEELYLPVVSP